MRIKTTVIVLAIFSLFGKIHAQEKEIKDLDVFVKAQVNIEADAVKSSAIEKIFNVQFFSVKRIPLYSSNGGFTETILMKSENGMQELYEPKEFIPGIKTDFRLNPDSSKDFEKVLNLLFPPMGSGKQEIVTQENRWIFILGEWFGEKQGYIVITDGEGKIIEIKKSENIEL